MCLSYGRGEKIRWSQRDMGVMPGKSVQTIRDIGFCSEKNGNPLLDFEQRNYRYYMTYILQGSFWLQNWEETDEQREKKKSTLGMIQDGTRVVAINEVTSGQGPVIFWGQSQQNMLEFWIWAVKESKEATMTPGILIWITAACNCLRLRKEKVVGRASL